MESKNRAVSEERSQETEARVAFRLLTSTRRSIDEAITASLRDVCRFVDADRATIVWFNAETPAIEVLYYWTDEGTPPTPRFRQGGFRWMSPMLLNGETVAFSSVSELPEGAESDARSLADMGIRSAIVTPIILENRTLGALSLTNSRRERDWTEHSRRALRIMAASFGSAIHRLQSEMRLDQLMRELAAAKEGLEAENSYLQQQMLSVHGFSDMIGESDALRACLKQIVQVARTPAPVLVYGETGTGKELVAGAIHAQSARANRNLIRVNCAALPASLIESELFGHEKGAFTGAIERRRGRFDLADGGTLFLDEIGELAPDLQAKLLRVLQDGEFQRVGGTETLRADVRIVAATNRDLEHLVDERLFRADLYYRINTFTIESPPLRRRAGDIPLLAQHFVNKHAPQLGKRITSISKQMLDRLDAHDWPGNIRELEGVIQRALISSSGPVLEYSGPIRRTGGEVRSRPAAVAEEETDAPAWNLRAAEITHIRAVLEASDWVIAGADGAAATLGVPPSTLRSRMKKLGIVRPATTGR